MHLLILFLLSMPVQAQTPPRVPTIGQVLSCGKTGTAGNLADGNDLQRYTFDTADFPNAVCNDGSPAIFYYRPYQGAENRNRWVIQLQGGGSCGSAFDCAKRWCSVGTNFSMVGMSSEPAPKRGIEGNGILERRNDNPLGDFNHVFVKYCSSDKWGGTAKDVIIDADHPVTGEQILMRISFLGSRILDSTLGVLRRQGGKTLRFTMSTPGVDLPSIDDATLVVLAGASGGAGGVTNNIDRLGAALRRTNNNCKGSTPCPLIFRGIHDSAFIPSVLDLDYSTSQPCKNAGYCTSQAILEHRIDSGEDFLWRTRGDESCNEWHRRNDPDNEWKCADDAYVLRNHITTPLFIRMGQTDSLQSSSQIEAGVSLPDGGGPMTLEGFARLVREMMAELPTWKTKGNESAAVTVNPGGFSPTCSKHETLSSNPDVYTVRINQPGGQPLTMLQVLANWFEGRSPSVVVAPTPAANTCPPE